MSKTDGTGGDVTVGIDSYACCAETTEFMHDVRELRAVYRPAHVLTFNGAIPDSDYPATVAVRIGNTKLTLTPEVWAAVNDAVQQVLPVDVVPA